MARKYPQNFLHASCKKTKTSLFALELAQRFKHSAPSLLMAVHTIDKDLMECLRHAVATYMSGSMPFDAWFLDEQKLIGAYEKHQKQILTAKLQAPGGEYQPSPIHGPGIRSQAR